MFDSQLDAGAQAFLRQSYANAWEQYITSLTTATANRAAWDVCVITASNAQQASAYEAQLEARRSAGIIPPRTDFVVLADPEGMRIGSGGATLRALQELHQRHAIADRRILLVHSGGDSRRLPHCSAQGKLFARVPHEWPDGRPSCLFDEVLVTLSGLPARIPPGVLIMSGDVLLLFDPLQLVLHRQGISGVATAVSAATAGHHGVYVTEPGSRRVQSFLHKPTMDRMTAAGALRPNGSALVDTGMVWFDASAVDRFLTLAREMERAIGEGLTINLYGDLLAPLAESTSRADYLTDDSDGSATPSLRRARERVWEGLRGLPYVVEELEPALFIHFGTTYEYRDVLRGGASLLASSGWASSCGCWLPASTHAAQRPTVAVNAFLAAGSAPDASLLDSALDGHATIGKGAIVANVVTSGELTLQPDLVLHQVPIDGGKSFVTRLFGVHDDPKVSIDRGGTFLNEPWDAWLACAQVRPDQLWAEDETERTLWNAKLFPVCRARDESLRLALWLQAPGDTPGDIRDAWRRADRVSLAGSYERADVSAIVREQARIEDRVRALRFLDGLREERPATQLATALGHANDVPHRARAIADELEGCADPWLPIRGYRALGAITGDSRWNDRAFAALARLVRAHTSTRTAARDAQFCGTDTITVRAAARLDFGGGWTDTPPYSLERGGRVLNAAITLHEQLPIVARARCLPEPRLELEASDIGAVLRPRWAGEVLDYANPADPLALHKAALVYSGIVPADAAPQAEIADILEPLGGGVSLSTATSIPRGSGLGTSSILAGAVLRSLAALLEDEIDEAQLFDRVLCLEQMITTGGGWQDQVGGLAPGIKLLTTQPGLPQVVHVEPLHLSTEVSAELASRMLLVHTGQHRLAKNLLRAIMGRYMARDPEMVALLREIADLAIAMRKALDADDLGAFGELVGEHWQANKRMDPDCTNAFIDGLFSLFRPYSCGAKLAGAGGGGFAIVIAHDAAAADALRAELARAYPTGPVAAWPCAISDTGVLLDRAALAAPASIHRLGGSAS